ncbi:MAG: DUF4238 domain-containing protein [Candidatus Kapabacteria bacterium]|nr:DUF4238 domain-containing protein [Candidatus Kapabacteria bacterium]
MKKRHHFIPQFYLGGFTDQNNPNHIYRYTKNRSKLISLSIKDACVQSHYYAFTMIDGKKDSEKVENYFQIIEFETSKILKKIAIRIELNFEERTILSHFIAFQLTRVPAFRNWILENKANHIKQVIQLAASNKESFDTTLNNVFEKKEKEINSEKLREFCLNGNYDIEYSEETSLQFMVTLAMDVAKIIYKMNWGFINSPNGSYFLTSDNPVFLADPSRNLNSLFCIGLIDRNVELTLPLTKEICFIGTWQNNIIGHFNYPSFDYIWEINRRTIISAQKYIFSPFKHDLINEIINNPTEKVNII